ncbi:hypothetical protein JCM10207_000448 [Rhodosporidiobolus poonsookiae]
MSTAISATSKAFDGDPAELSPVSDHIGAAPLEPDRHASESSSLDSSLDKDLEKNDYVAGVSDDGKEVDAHVEVAELSATEAFKVSVDGDQSPFPEVAACVPNTDDPTIQINHFRMWFLLTVFAILFSGVNQFFALRYPSLTVGYVVAQLLVFPIGKAWEKLPTMRVGWGRASFRLNPGKFMIKEHAIIAICVNLTGSSAYSTGAYVSMVNDQFWDRGSEYSAGFGFLFILTTQMLGFGFAGLARRWIVWPGAMVWPSTLASTVLFRALHEKQDRSPANGWTISRYRFFGLVTSLSFAWFWFPDYIWTSLSSFDFIAWIWPNNQKVNTVFGMSSGLGLLPITFDWTQITYAGQPLTTPFYVSANCWAAIAIFYLFLGPILYYKNVWHSARLPFLTSTTFDNTGGKYNVTNVITNGNFDLAKYKAYGPMFISMSYSLSYGLNFAAVTGVLVYTILYNRQEIWSRLKDSRAGGEDIHRRLMRKSYREVPWWWYAVLQVIVIALGILAIRNWDTQLPVWGFVVICVGFPIVFMIPEGFLEGTCNQRIFLNIITELIAGYAWPGKPIANLMVKHYGYNSVKHGLDFAMDLKLGQYMKIAPRLLFSAQVYAAVLSAAVQTGVLRWMQGHIENLCHSDNSARFTCAGTKVVYNASVIWGTIGPQRMFEHGQIYNGLLHFFWIGPVTVLIVYLLYRRWPKSWLRYVNLPILFNIAGNIPPANTMQYSAWFLTAFAFNYVVRRRAFQWWKRYTYLLSAALDTGVALATIIIFFALSYHNVKFTWWGNTVGSNTMDAKGTPWLATPKGTTFGPAVGEF